MKALRFDGETLTLSDIGKPSVGDDEALVRVLQTGICNTDLEIVRGYAGFSGTLGHEFVGVVEAAASAPELVGRRVVGEINAGCGRCELCLGGDPRHCAFRSVLGIHGREGAHAEFLRLPAVNLLAVPDGVSDDQAIFAEPLAAAVGITEQVAVGETTRVAVVGDGKLGLLCAMSLALRSRRVTLVGKHREKMARAAGVEGVLLADALPELARSFEVVVEASGSESGFATALDLILPRGKLVLKSTFQGKPALEMWRVVVDEITIVGSRCGRFAPALEILRDRRIDVESLITDRFPLDRGVDAMARAAEKGALKVVLEMRREGSPRV